MATKAGRHRILCFERSGSRRGMEQENFKGRHLEIQGHVADQVETIQKGKSGVPPIVTQSQQTGFSRPHFNYVVKFPAHRLLRTSQADRPDRRRRRHPLDNTTPDTSTMGRLHSNGKGISASAVPYSRTPPSWLKTTPEQVVDQICKLAKKGATPSQIGVVLRDSHGIAQVRIVTGMLYSRGGGWGRNWRQCANRIAKLQATRSSVSSRAMV